MRNDTPLPDGRSPSGCPDSGCTTLGIAVNADGAVEIHFGPKAPAHKANWIQTVPGKGWNTILRLYSPLQPWFDETWRPGEIEPAVIRRQRTGAA